MKVVLVSLLVAGVVALSTTQEMECHHKKPDIPKDWIDMADPCVKKVREQIQEEIKAAVQYLALGAHFARDTVNRPGFAKFFFESASEERQHALHLIEYLLRRGELTSDVSNLLKRHVEPPVQDWDSGVSALKEALRLETYVTKKIQALIKVCESPDGTGYDFNDYHLVDYLTGVYLEEQIHSQRDLAGKISTLDKLMGEHATYGEYLFDKQVLKGEL